MKGLNHINIVELIDYFVDDTYQYVVMELLQGPDLCTLMQESLVERNE
jgi:serine/threonine protein kinase